jgi:hypothetical protein
MFFVTTDGKEDTRRRGGIEILLPRVDVKVTTEAVGSETVQAQDLVSLHV